MAVGDQLDVPSSYRIIVPTTGTLSPEWRDVIEQLVDLVNELSTEVKTLKENAENG